MSEIWKNWALEAIRPANLSHLSLVFGSSADDFPNTDLRQSETDLTLWANISKWFQHISRISLFLILYLLVFACFRKESACRADSGRVGLGKRPHAWAKDKQLPSGTDSLSQLSDARRSLDHSELVLSSLCSLKNTHPQHDSDYRSLSVFSLTHCSRKLQWQE